MNSSRVSIGNVLAGATFVAATLLLPTAKLATADIYVEARSSSFSQTSPYGLDSHALAQNGVVPAGDSNRSSANGSTSAGPIGTGVTSAFANTSQIDGSVLTDSSTQADLGKGSLSVVVNAGGGEGIGASIGFGAVRWTETVTFQNANDFPVEFDVFWDTSGSVTDTGGPNAGSIDIESSIVLAVVNDANYKDVHLKGSPAHYLGGCQYIYSGQFGAYFTYKPAGNNDTGSWIGTATGSAGGLIKTTLVIPSGVVSVSITTLLSIDARSGAVCDFNEGAKFVFGELPAGLTWTSESGVFLASTPAGSADADGDGTPDTADGCPADAAKTAAGTCGCGQVDSDMDGDGVCDGVDNCLNAANAEQADADADGIGDVCETSDSATPEETPAAVGEEDPNMPDVTDGDNNGAAVGLSFCGPIGLVNAWLGAVGLMLMRRRWGR